MSTTKEDGKMHECPYCSSTVFEAMDDLTGNEMYDKDYMICSECGQIVTITKEN